ncbi:SGNH/GDSL hydrolase family protein [Microbacterium aquimaris]|uniref:SGNH/GDSL hydrolase family protein n=1 Tax=Microbacterium aquimaris TaxID=459816 RepID=A0ABU5N8M1_9MICO|nr:SGNH/GDSL hydrolase family protein [Microbacterium aquimaris]MDZ8162424.1 SGNH/GDSL hydrolase family protein [Microbacterium aquimaris]
MARVRYVAIGDSFSEGVGDELPDGSVRGWADLVARGWADGSGAPVEYANLAIRGKLIWPIVQEQLEQALALRPTHLSFNGGGNDMLRPRVPLSRVTDAFSTVLERCDEEGVTMILLSGANPSSQLPLSRLIQSRGDELSRQVVARVADRPDVIKALNWPDRELSHPGYWSQDRLHMNSRGHHRVAARVLSALGVEAPGEWWSMPPLDLPRLGAGTYAREHLGPWVRRRLTGTSSGDGRAAKHPSLITVAPGSGEAAAA